MTTPSPFRIIPAQGPAKPILISVPHAGTAFPPEVAEQLDPQHVQHPDDTDWFVDQLYDFAPALGITMLVANYSRYVIDLNRDPSDAPLYDDGRVITELVPTRTFLDEPLYPTTPPTQEELARRRSLYYDPYHDELRSLLEALRGEFPHVLLWDAHSIRRVVSTIRPDPFPDLILGNQQGKTADAALIDCAWRHLSEATDFHSAHNTPFQGGTITRSFGQPTQGIHALQLEMTKPNYMDEDTTTYLPTRAATIRALLQTIFLDLAETLRSL